MTFYFAPKTAAGAAMGPFPCLVRNIMTDSQNAAFPGLNLHVAMQVINAIRHAGTDKQVRGFAAHIGDIPHHRTGLRLADIQELQDAILHFRQVHADFT